MLGFLKSTQGQNYTDILPYIINVVVLKVYFNLPLHVLLMIMIDSSKRALAIVRRMFGGDDLPDLNPIENMWTVHQRFVPGKTTT